MIDKDKTTKQKAETENKLRKTRRVWPDYHHLNDPESEDKISKDRDNWTQEIFAAEIGNEFQSLKEVKESFDWPEWKDVIKAKLDQHQAKGTWEIVDKLADAIPLTNKWVMSRRGTKRETL